MLSIDKSIQYIVDRELAAGVEKAQAKAGTAIVMESDTGRILALSNYPQFNSNTYMIMSRTSGAIARFRMRSNPDLHSRLWLRPLPWKPA